MNKTAGPAGPAVLFFYFAKISFQLTQNHLALAENTINTQTVVHPTTTCNPLLLTNLQEALML